MTADEVIQLLETFEKRLDAIADQARQTADLAGKLRDEVKQIRDRILATTETQVHPAAKRTKK